MMSGLLIVLVATAATAYEISTDLIETLDPHNVMKMTTKDVDILDELSSEDTFLVPRSNLSVGEICKEDVLLANGNYMYKPSRDKIHSKDILIEGDSTIVITAIRVNEVGVPQNGKAYGKAFVKEGGMGQNYVVIRIQSAKGYCYHLKTEVWGLQTK